MTQQTMRRIRPRKLWQDGDRVVNRETGAEAIVLVFCRDTFYASGYYCELDTDNDGDREVYGNWGAMSKDWKLEPPTPTA